MFQPTIADLEAAADGFTHGGVDAYFALASFTESTTRSADNAAFLRAFFIDLDCGMGKPYADQPEAAQALAAFLASTDLPAPTVVNSGYGLHVYWPLTADIPATEWVGYAKRLKRLCAAHNLYADPAVTADAARILRVPGTHNFKHDTARPVQIMATGAAVDIDVFAEALPAAPVDLSAAKAFGMDETTRDMVGGDYPSCSFARIAKRSLTDKGCAQVKHALVNAKDLEEPLWRGVLSIAVRCVDGQTAIHKVSKAHPEYTDTATEAKAAETKGPYTCQWYKDNYPATCAGCTQRVSSPLLLGKIVEAATPTENDTYIVDAPASDTTPAMELAIPAYPYPYFRGASGGVFKKETDADGNVEEVEIYRDDLYITERFYDSDEYGNGDGEMVGINLHMRKDGIRRFYTPVTTLFAKDKLRDLLVRNGVIPFGKTLEALMTYFASSIRKLQTQYAANKTRNQMGWTPDMLGFVVGELEYTSTGTKLAPPASGTRELASAFKPTGSLSEWKEIVNFYDRPGLEPHAFTVFLGFGSPLLRLIGGNVVKGAMVHLKNNGSGSGKSTAQMVANSIFGHPDDLLMKKDDTYNSKMHMLGMLNSLLYTVDEITNETPEIISAMAYGFTSGRGKHRMDGQTNKLRINHTTWCNFTVTSANASVVDILQRFKSTADGELRRVLELSVPKYTGASKTEIDNTFAKLIDNYGLAGPVFIEYVLTHLPQVEKMLQDMQAKVDREFELDQADRFYSCLVTCAFTGALIAQRLGLHDIDLKHVYKYIQVEVAANRTTNKLAVGDPVVIAQEALGSYVNENVNNALVASYTPPGGVPERPAIMPRGPLKMRYDPESHELAIPATELRNYFTARQIDVKEAVSNLTARGYMKHSGKAHPTRLGAGAIGGLSGIAVRCFVFDGDALGLDRENFVPADC